jgi:hypothetical protein
MWGRAPRPSRGAQRRGFFVEPGKLRNYRIDYHLVLLLPPAYTPCSIEDKAGKSKREITQ